MSQAGYEPGSHTSNFSNAPLPASNNFWTKVQLSTKQDAFLATSILLSLIIFTNYCTAFLKFRYRDIVAFCTKNWMDVNFVSDLDLLQTSRFPLWRGKILSNHFEPPCDGKVHNCFRVFWYVFLYAYPKRFMGGRESCACFRNNIPFFRPSRYFQWSNDFDNRQHFVSNFLWLIVCHWWAGNFVNKFCHSS